MANTKAPKGAPKGDTKQDVAMKAASKKSVNKKARRQLGYYVAIGVGVGSVILAGAFAVMTGSKKTSQKSAYKSKTASSTPSKKSNEPFEAKGEILRIMDGFDVNKDGKLSLDELRGQSAPKIEAAAKEGKEHADLYAGWEGGFPKADANKDGYLSGEEVSEFVNKVTWQQVAEKFHGQGPPADPDYNASTALTYVMLIANPIEKPEEPQEPEKPKINITEAAVGAAEKIMSMLGDNVEVPKEILSVKQAVEEGEPMAIGTALYKMLTWQTLEYDMNNGTMVPTVADYANKEDLRVREKVGYIYRYGIHMAMRGLLSDDALEDVVVTSVASRLGMDGVALDKWLNITGLWSRHEEAQNDSKSETKS